MAAIRTLMGKSNARKPKGLIMALIDILNENNYRL